MLITAVTVSKKKKFFDLYIDEELFATIPEQTLIDYQVIKKGNEIEEVTLRDIVRDSMIACAYNDGMTYISSTMRTTREVRDKLSRIGYTAEAIEDAISRMTGYGYLDDSDYATRYVDRYRETKGTVRLAHELRSKGVSEEHITLALEGFDEYTYARLEAERVYPRMKYDKQKVYRHLMVRGYTASTCGEVIGEVEDHD